MTDPDKSKSLEVGKSDKKVTISSDLIQRLRLFIQDSNNHLMGIPVSGDDILLSAKVMIEAQDLNRILETIDGQ